jgi:TrmH family RNA methyltransferase
LTALGARHHDVRRLRVLLRERAARAEDDAFVLEGPRVVAAALDRDASLQTVYLGIGADRAFAGLVERVQAAGTPLVTLRDGVPEKIGTTRSPQPVFALARRRSVAIDALKPGGHVVVTVDVADPGNLGTIMRSAEASGASGVVVTGPRSADAHHPKVVRSSAGAIFGIQVAEEVDPAAALDRVGAGGRTRIAARVADARPFDEVDLARPCALVLGNEARGIPPELDGHLDDAVRVPMSGAAESLNVAMAATVLCFEAARQRRAAAVAP